MIALEFTETKEFMKQLLLSETFDAFLVTEGVITTYTTFIIDGLFHPEFYAEETTDLAAFGERGYVFWRTVKPTCLELIKGKNTPLSFRFVFRLNDSNTQKIIVQEGLSFTPDDVQGLYLNIRFEQGKLRATTAASLAVFSLDKTLFGAWDRLVKRFFDSKGIGYEEL